MNDEEIRSSVEQVRAQMKSKEENKGKTDDEIDEIILDNLFKGYTEGQISKSDLEAIANVMGYEFTEEFTNDEDATEMVEPDEGEGLGGISKEELEDTRTIGEGESVEDFKEDIEDINAGKTPESDEEEPEENEEEEESEESEDEIDDEDEDAQREAASKIFGTDLRKK